MRHLLDRFLRFWDADRSLSALLLTLILAILVVPAADVWAPRVARPLSAAVVTMILLSGIGTTARRKIGLTLAVGVGVGPLVAWLFFHAVEGAIDAVEAGLNGVFMMFLAILVLRSVFREGPITWHRIQGAIAAFLLVGFAFAMVYRMVLMADAAAFAQPGAPGARVTVAELSYFSFVSLATLGYGDIVPVNPLARSLAILEALLGLMYPAVLIARLVSLQLAAELERRPHR
jgi:hypothetical protein